MTIALDCTRCGAWQTVVIEVDRHWDVDDVSECDVCGHVPAADSREVVNAVDAERASYREWAGARR